jgi:hypothetical protein
MKNKPNKIYLQIDEDDFDDDFNEISTTWCSDKINENDLEYTLSSATTAQIEARDAYIKILEEYSDADPKYIQAIIDADKAAKGE